MKTTTVGQQAEAAVAQYLEKRGFKIIDKNWRTKICEIDIVVKKRDVVYFVVVKYRGTPAQGSGFEYIGPKKLSQLKFAASIWVQNCVWEGDFRIMGAAVTGMDFGAIELVEIE